MNVPLCKVLSFFQYPVLVATGGCSPGVRSWLTSLAMHMPVATGNRHATLRTVDRGEGFRYSQF